MAETLLSPGVLTRENDQSQVTQGPVTVGAARFSTFQRIGKSMLLL